MIARFAYLLPPPPFSYLTPRQSCSNAVKALLYYYGPETEVDVATYSPC